MFSFHELCQVPCFIYEFYKIEDNDNSINSYTKPWLLLLLTRELTQRNSQCNFIFIYFWQSEYDEIQDTLRSVTPPGRQLQSLLIVCTNGERVSTSWCFVRGSTSLVVVTLSLLSVVPRQCLVPLVIVVPVGIIRHEDPVQTQWGLFVVLVT